MNEIHDIVFVHMVGEKQSGKLAKGWDIFTQTDTFYSKSSNLIFFPCSKLIVKYVKEIS